MKERILQHAPLPEYLLDILNRDYDVIDGSDSSVDELNDYADGCRIALSSGEDRFGEDVMRHLPNLRLIASFGVGYDGIDLEAAKSRGILVSNTPGVVTDDVADLAVGFLVALCRQIKSSDLRVGNNEWNGFDAAGQFWSRKVTGSSVGILGLGRIGSAVVDRLLPFRADIHYSDVSPVGRTGLRFHDSAMGLAEHVSTLIVCAPGGSGTRHLVDGNTLAALGPDGYLINVSRGSVVDEAALVHAIVSGGIAGAALDVFEDEPHVPRELLNRPNVILTPHMGTGTVQTRHEMCALVKKNIDSWCATADVPNLVVVR